MPPCFPRKLTMHLLSVPVDWESRSKISAFSDLSLMQTDLLMACPISGKSCEPLSCSETTLLDVFLRDLDGLLECSLSLLHGLLSTLAGSLLPDSTSPKLGNIAGVTSFPLVCLCTVPQWYCLI